jgi:hypothetical protein
VQAPFFGGADTQCLAQLLAQYPGTLAAFGAKFALIARARRAVD